MCWCWQLCIGKANPPTWRTIIIAVYFFIIFFLLNGDKWPFRFVALKFKCTNIYKQLACSVLCFIKKGGEGWGGKGEELVTRKNEENYPFGGWGWEKKGNNPFGGSSNTYFKFWQRVNTWNIGFETLYSGQTMLSTWLVALNYNVILSHPHSSTVSLETYPLYLFQTVLHMCSTLEKVRIYFNHKPKKHFILMM